MMIKALPLSAVITRPTITRYCIHHCSDGAEYKYEIWYTKDTPHLALTGELWCVLWENFGENWSCYNGTALYLFRMHEYVSLWFIMVILWGHIYRYSLGYLTCNWAIIKSPMMLFWRTKHNIKLRQEPCVHILGCSLCEGISLLTF